MTASIPIDNLIRSVPFSQAEWDQTPSAVQAHLAALDTTVTTLEAQLQQLQQQVDQLQGRLDQTSSTSSKPPSSDSPFKTRKPRQSSGQRGGKKGHRGAGPKLLEPTEVEVVFPPSCSCGHAVVSAPTPYRTHQVLELPPIQIEVTHFLLHQSTCLGCGQTLVRDHIWGRESRYSVKPGKVGLTPVKQTGQTGPTRGLHQLGVKPTGYSGHFTEPARRFLMA